MDFVADMTDYADQVLKVYSETEGLIDFLDDYDLSDDQISFIRDETITAGAKFLLVAECSAEETFSEFSVKAKKALTNIKKARASIEELMGNNAFTYAIELYESLIQEYENTDKTDHVVIRSLLKNGFKSQNSLDTLLYVYQHHVEGFLNKTYPYQARPNEMAYLLWLHHMEQFLNVLELPLTQGHYHKGEKSSDFSGYTSPAMDILFKYLKAIHPPATQSRLAEAIKFYNKKGGMKGFVENLNF